MEAKKVADEIKDKATYNYNMEIKDMMEVIQQQIEELDNLFLKYETKQVKLMREDPREMWRSVNGFSNYEVSTQGRVRNITTDMFLKPIENVNGYLMVNLYKNKVGKMHYIHRLVAQEFLENPLELPWVDHADRDKKNNCVLNLRFCTQSQNRMNSRKKASASSAYKGVDFRKCCNLWRARIRKDGTEYLIGLFENEIDAARAYNKKATELFGEFKNLNVIPDES